MAHTLAHLACDLSPAVVSHLGVDLGSGDALVSKNSLGHRETMLLANLRGDEMPHLVRGEGRDAYTLACLAHGLAEVADLDMLMEPLSPTPGGLFGSLTLRRSHRGLAGFCCLLAGFCEGVIGSE